MLALCLQEGCIKTRFNNLELAKSTSIIVKHYRLSSFLWRQANALQLWPCPLPTNSKVYSVLKFENRYIKLVNAFDAVKVAHFKICWPQRMTISKSSSSSKTSVGRSRGCSDLVSKHSVRLFSRMWLVSPLLLAAFK